MSIECFCVLSFSYLIYGCHRKVIKVMSCSDSRPGQRLHQRYNHRQSNFNGISAAVFC